MQNEIKCLDHGFVALVDTMGTDRTPAQCARTSFRNAGQDRTEEQDAKLTNYLVRNHHTTPLEFVQARFYIKAPIFVARQIMRHRTASINEVSYRYVEAKPEFYVPDLDKLTKRPANTKQGRSDELVDTPYGLQREIRYLYKEAFDSYEALLRNGLAPEVARIVLPLGTYTEWYWQNDMNNILKFLSLRMDDHAQYETRVYAQAVHDLLLPRYPNILAAWRAGNV